MKTRDMWMLMVTVLLAGSVCAFAQTNVNEEQGMKPYDSWHGGSLDSVSMTNGGLVLHIPLASFPQRGNLDLSFSVYANTKQWQSKVNPLGCPNPSTVCVPQWSPIAGIQGAYVASSLDWAPDNQCSVEPGNENNGFTPTYTWSNSVSAPDGNIHPFGSGSSPYGCGGLARALDASGILQTASNNITMPNGTRFTYDSFGLLSNVTDTNGNRITMDTQPARYTDTLGRIIALPPNTFSMATTDLSNCPLGTATAKAWAIPGLSGGTRTFKFCYSNISIYTSFGQGGPEYGPVNSSLLTAIVLPNLTLWTFSYDHYGDVTQLGFPTGGSISYTYAMGPQACGSGTPVSMAVTSRTVNANDDTGGHTWLYAYSGYFTPLPASYSGTTIVTSPDGNDTVHSITSPVAGASCSFYDTQVQYYQGAHNGGALLKTIVTQYAGIANPVGSDSMTAANVVPIQVTTAWPDGHSSKVVNAWDTGNTVAGSDGLVQVVLGSLMQKDEYDFSNALLRSTVNHYLWQDNTTYKNNNLLELVTSTTTKDGTGNQVAQSTFAFDQTAVISSGVATRLVAPPAGGNIRGNATTASHWLNTTNSFISGTATYLDTGMKASSTDPLSNTTSYTYSSAFAGAYVTQTNMPDTQMPDSGAPVIHHVISGNYDFNTGLLTSFTDENSQTYTYQYDNMLRLTQSNHPDGGQSKFLYPDPNTVEQQRLINGTTFDDYKVKFDGLGRPYQSQGVTPSGTVLTDTTYDSIGHVGTVSNPYYQGNSHSIDPTYGITQTQYDALGRSTKTIKPDGSFSTASYIGNCTTTMDEAGKLRKACADAQGRIVSVFEDPNGLNYETDYQYDVLNNLLRVDQKGGFTDTTKWRTRLFTYDSFSRILTAMNPETNSTGTTKITYTYDNDGNILSKTGPAPNYAWGSPQTLTISYTHDALNRLLDTTYSAGTTQKTSQRYDYPSFQGQTSAYPIGRGVSAITMDASNNIIASSFVSYDRMGRVASTVQCNPGVSGCKTITANYGPAGQLLSLVYPNSFTVTYGYDSAARLTSVTDSNGVTYAQNPTMLASGAVQELTAPNFNNLKYHVDYNNRLQPIEIWAGTGPGAGALFDKTYSYNAPNTSQMNNGNIYTVTNVKDSTRTQSFAYDVLNRLTSAGDQTHWANSYVYDPWGNLYQKNPGSPAGENMIKIADGNNHLSGITYDAAGNEINDGLGNSFVFDAENRITTAVGVTYTYDAGGRRIKKSSGSNYWYGPTGTVLAETDASGNWTNYIFFGSQRLARNINGDIKYYITDHLHSTAMFVDKAGTQAAILDDNDFYPWGGIVPGVGRTTSNNTVKFTGQYRDTESNLDYFGARYYANVTGRFMSPDWAASPTSVPYAEFGDPQSLNLYSYTRNSPIVRVDDDGHSINADPFGTFNTPLYGEDLATEFISPQDLLGSGRSQPRQQQSGGTGANVVAGAGKEVANEIRSMFLLSLEVTGNGDFAKEMAKWAPELKGSNEQQEAAMKGVSIILLFVPGGAEEAAATKGAKAAKELVSVYRIVEGDRVMYVGITNDLLKREAAHGAKLRPIIDGLSREEARGVEQVLIEHYGFERIGGTLRNKINSISPTKDAGFYKAAKEFGKKTLEWIGYKF